ncbi:MAG: Flp family type IVb pilin [Clostridiales bacterium]|nr:Flp family type IVb pilin [Clostridiales bacterium]
MMEEENMKNFWKNEEGQGMVEYGLIIALVAVVVIAALTLIGTNVRGKFQEIVTGLGGTN